MAVEPNGPAVLRRREHFREPEWFRDAASPTNAWGISAVPLAYFTDRPRRVPDLAIVRQDKPDAPDLVQVLDARQSPARLLPNLAKLPILILTAEASYHAPYDHCTVKYLQQAGVRSTWIKLGDVGIHGNGHMMMLEKNSQEIGAVVSGWLTENTGGPSEIAGRGSGARSR